MILDDVVQVKTAGVAIAYYRNLGYECGYNTVIDVKVSDLSKGSKVKVRAACDYCGVEVFIPYRDYNKSFITNGKFSCYNCKGKKAKETNFIKYGTENVSQLEEVKEKKRQTMLNKYGVEHPLQSKEILEKLQKTNLEKYGCKCSFQNENVRQVFKNNMLQKYGVDHPWKVNEIKEKVNNAIFERYGVTNISYNKDIKKKKRQKSQDRYGVDYILQSSEVREQIAKTLYEYNSQKVSNQQYYLYNLYGGELNYPISRYCADICLLEDNIDIEYNGGGHSLSVIKGQLTQQEFDRKEMVRQIMVRNAGYKQIIITSSNDYLPSDDVLIRMLEEAKEYFNATVHTWVEYDIDKSIMRNAVNQDGIYYDFGVLRKIKRTA